MKKFTAEFIGTMIMVFAGCISSVAVNTMLSAIGFTIPIGLSAGFSALAFGLAVTLVYYAIGHISGAHINPAVTLGMTISKDMPVKECIGYMISQVLGALAGTALTALALNYRTVMFTSGYGDQSTFGTPLYSAIMIDVIMTFAFVLVYLTLDGREEMRKLQGIILGLAFTVVYMVEIPFTNGSSNPAKSIATALLQTDHTALKQVWVFIVAPLLGAALASLFYIFINGEKEEKNGDDGQEKKEEVPVDEMLEELVEKTE